MAQGRKQTTYHIRRVVEYSSFFKGEPPIDICSTLKRFNRTSLIRTATVLSLHYGNYSIPDGKRTLFSESSKKHVPYLNKMFKSFYERENIAHGEKIEILTYRTSLELWRWIFSIRAEEFTNEVDESDFELLLFKVILAINEKIISFKERKEQYQLDELLFLNGFLTNDSNHYDIKTILQPQMYYFQQLVDFIPSNEVLTKATEKLFHDWGIKSWQPYYTTIICIASETDKYITNNASGVPIITPKWITTNQGDRNFYIHSKHNIFPRKSLLKCSLK